MAQEPDDENFDGEGGEADFEGGGGGGKKKLLLFVVLPLVLVLGGGAAAYFTGMADPLIAMFTGGEEHAEEGAAGEHKPEAAASAAGDGATTPETISHYPLNEMLVNIGGTGRKRMVLKVRFVLEFAQESDIAKAELVLPRIEDSFITYLREVRAEDLDGTAGTYRLKEELLNRVNAALRPTQVREVLIKDFIIQ